MVFKVFQSKIHQLLCVAPFVGFIVWPSAGKQCHHKGTVISFQRTYIAITGIAGESGFPGQRTVHHGKKGIVVIAGKGSPAGDEAVLFFLIASEGIGCCFRDFKKFFPLWGIRDTIGHNPRQICGGGGMSPDLTVRTGHCGIQPVRCNKEGVKTADVSCFLVHHICKGFCTAGNMLRNYNRRVIVGFQHKRIEKILQLEVFTGFHIKLDLRHAGCIGGGFRIVFRISAFKSKNTGHNLCGACHGQNMLSIFFI